MSQAFTPAPALSTNRSWQLQPYAGALRICRVDGRIGRGEVAIDSGAVVPRHRGGPAPGVGQHADVEVAPPSRDRPRRPGPVLVAEHDRDHDARLADHVSSAYIVARATRPLPSSNGWTSETRNSCERGAGEPGGRSASRAKPSTSVPSTRSGATNTYEPAWFGRCLNSPGRFSGRPRMTERWRRSQQPEQVLGVLGHREPGRRDRRPPAKVPSMSWASSAPAREHSTRRHDGLGLLDG